MTKSSSAPFEKDSNYLDAVRAIFEIKHMALETREKMTSLFIKGNATHDVSVCFFFFFFK